MSSGAQDVLDREGRTETENEPRNTVPTPDELAQQTKDAELMIGGRQDGSMFCEVFQVSDGYAFRPWGSKNHADWQWLRSEDFDRAFVAFSMVDMEHVYSTITALATTAMKWERRAKTIFGAMGRKSRIRLGKKFVNMMG